MRAQAGVVVRPGWKSYMRIIGMAWYPIGPVIMSIAAAGPAASLSVGAFWFAYAALPIFLCDSINWVAENLFAMSFVSKGPIDANKNLKKKPSPLFPVGVWALKVMPCMYARNSYWNFKYFSNRASFIGNPVLALGCGEGL